MKLLPIEGVSKIIMSHQLWVESYSFPNRLSKVELGSTIIVTRKPEHESVNLEVITAAAG